MSTADAEYNSSCVLSTRPVTSLTLTSPSVLGPLKVVIHLVDLEHLGSRRRERLVLDVQCDLRVRRFLIVARSQRDSFSGTDNDETTTARSPERWHKSLTKCDAISPPFTIPRCPNSNSNTVTTARYAGILSLPRDDVVRKRAT